MHPDIYDIHFARVKWRESESERPWLIVNRTRDGKYHCLPISTKKYDDAGLFIDVSTDDGKATKLTANCYVIYDVIHEIPPDKFTRPKGKLSGTLLERFKREEGY